MSYNEGGNSRRGRNRNAIIIIAVLIVIAVIVFLIRSCDGGSGNSSGQGSGSGGHGIVYDPGAVVGGWNEADISSIVDGLNEKVREGMINISMNTSPYFRNGSEAGNLMIVNEGMNRYPQVVEIVRNDTGEQIYRSGAIPVGSKIESAKLGTVLPAGIYDCTALFYNVDPSTGNYLGCAGAVIQITVLE